MTPLQIEIVLHYATRATDYRDGDQSAPAVRDAISYFIEQGVLKWLNSDRQPFYGLTDRGKAYVNGLVTLPLPVAKWEFPTP